MSLVEQAALANLNINSRIYAILQLGYFKARQQFYRLEYSEIQEDLAYICHIHFPIAKTVHEISKDTWAKLQRIVLQLTDYRLCLAPERQLLALKAANLAKISSKPIYVFRELLQFLAIKRIVMPAYNTLRDIVGHALEREKARLIRFAQEHILEEATDQLRSLLTRQQGLYEVTQLKHSPGGFGFDEMQREIARGEQIHSLYHLAKMLIPRLEISVEGVKHYASLVMYYSVFRLRQLDEHLVHIYLLCFIFQRYQRFQDNLITYFLVQVRQFINNAKDTAKMAVAMHRMEQNRNLQQAGHILLLFTDDTIPANTSFGEVRSRAFGLLERSKLSEIASQITTNSQLDEVAFQWLSLDEKAMEFKRRLRRVVRTITFTFGSEGDPLTDALRFLQTAFQKRTALWHFPESDIPTGHIPDSVRHYLYTKEDGQKRLLHDRYEFLVYRLLRNRLEAGDAFCQESIRFRSFEDDLLSPEQWRRKEILIANSNLPLLQQPIRQQLDFLKEELESQIRQVNERIISGENDHINVKQQEQSRRWSLSYSSPKPPVNHPFFDTLPLLDVSVLIQIVNEQTGFLKAFDHILHRYAARQAEQHVLIAALVAWGTNLGIGRMGNVSNVPYAHLIRASSSFIRLETLRTANEMIVNALAQLPLFPLYNIGNTIHSSSDGQKFETRLHTFNARYSPKYFGLQKGVVSYSLIANHVPLYAKVIGANEHESHFVFDLLHNNSTDVQPAIHSTDTHGANNVNFALLHMFGYQFAPRYKDIYDKVRTSLYGFQHPTQYDERFLIRPIRKIQEPLMVDEWQNFQHIILSLALKTTTQSVVVGKLSSFARRNRTKRAIWEYDNILCSRYLLRFINDLTLRRNVTRALNRGESYHQLRRAVSHANFGKLRFKTEEDQQIWNESSRLIANCIIYYNVVLLSKFLELKQQQGDEEGITALTRISPIAWQHINFYGRFEFSSSKPEFDLDALVYRFVEQPIPSDNSD